MDLRGKVAIVTGSASGMEAASTKEFIKAGAGVAIVDRNEALVHQFATELGAEVRVADVRDSAFCNGVVGQTVEQHGRLDVLVNAAGYDAAQLALLWVKNQPGIRAPTIGPKGVEQLELLLPVLDMKLPEETRAACNTRVPPGSAVANFHNSAPWMKMQLDVGRTGRLLESPLMSISKTLAHNAEITPTGLF